VARSVAARAVAERNNLRVRGEQIHAPGESLKVLLTAMRLRALIH